MGLRRGGYSGGNWSETFFFVLRILPPSSDASFIACDFWFQDVRFLTYSNPRGDERHVVAGDVAAGVRRAGVSALGRAHAGSIKL